MNCALLWQMNLKYSTKFLASFRNLVKDQKRAALAAIALFQEYPYHPALHNHALTGRMIGKRAFAADSDLRIVFSDRSDYRDVTLLDIGKHEDVYRR